jgi:hypothetical protein
MLTQLGGQSDDYPLHVGLDQVVVEADAFTEVGVELERSVGHLHHKSGRLLRRGFQHQRQRVMGGDQMRVNAHAEHPQPTG